MVESKPNASLAVAALPDASEPQSASSPTAQPISRSTAALHSETTYAYACKCLLLYRTAVRDYDIMRALHVHVHGVYGMGTACVPTYTSYSLALGLGMGLGFDVG